MTGLRRSDADRVELRAAPDAPRDDTGGIDLDAIVHALGPCDLLDSADGTGWSYVVPHDGPVLRDDGRRTLLDDGAPTALGTDPFEALDQWCATHGVGPDRPRDPQLPPFSGGLVGALAYDLARRIEHIVPRAAADRRQDHLALRVAEVVVAITADRDRAVVIGRDLTGRPGLRARVDDTVARVAAAVPADPRAWPTPPPQPVSTSLPAAAYRAAARRVLEHIAAGDSFQVNLTQRLTARWPGTTHELYRALRAHSPAGHGAALPGVGVASVSPETFLEVDGGRVRTRPIKGTRPRADDPHVDAALADDLATAAKDRAENVMIVDLQRNDLGRVCQPGTVRATQLAELQAHPTVWHLVSTVVGGLRPEVGYGGLLRATFPCGSITGAPKVRSMAIIEALEPVRRGWYCGAIGYLAPGAAALSVAIRTATTFPDGTVDHGVGGGIVADSDPADEHAESMAKAAAFLRTVRATTVQGA